MKPTIGITHILLDIRILSAVIFLAFAMAPWIGTLDHHFANLFFDAATGEWPIPEGRPLIWYLLYRGPKYFLGLLAFCMLTVFICSFYMPKLVHVRRPVLISLLALGIIPGACVWLKHMTDVYCPIQLTLYGGDFLYTDLFESHSSDFQRLKHGECWPAGHASGGFALMGIMVFARREDWWSRFLLTIPGFTLGWVMGIFQMIRGHHFLSHTVATLGIALLVIWALDWSLSYRE